MSAPLKGPCLLALVILSILLLANYPVRAVSRVMSNSVNKTTGGSSKTTKSAAAAKSFKKKAGMAEFEANEERRRARASSKAKASASDSRSPGRKVHLPNLGLPPGLLPEHDIIKGVKYKVAGLSMVKPHRERAKLLRDVFRSKFAFLRQGFASHEELAAQAKHNVYTSSVHTAFGGIPPPDHLQQQEERERQNDKFGASRFTDYDGSEEDRERSSAQKFKDANTCDVKGLGVPLTVAPKKKPVVTAESESAADKVAGNAYTRLQDVDMAQHKDDRTWMEHIYASVYHLTPHEAARLAIEAAMLINGGDSTITAMTVAYYMFFGAATGRVTHEEAERMARTVLSPGEVGLDGGGINVVNRPAVAGSIHAVTHWDVLEGMLGPSIYMVVNQVVCQLGARVASDNIFTNLTGAALTRNGQIAISVDNLGGRLSQFANYFLRWVMPTWTLSYTPEVATSKVGTFSLGQVESGDYATTGASPAMTFADVLQMEECKAVSPYQSATISTENNTNRFLYSEHFIPDGAGQQADARQTTQNVVCGANLNAAPGANDPWGTLWGSFSVVFSQITPDIAVAPALSLRSRFGKDVEAFFKATAEPENAELLFEFAEKMGVDSSSKPCPQRYVEFAQLATLAGLAVPKWPELSGYAKYLMKRDVDCKLDGIKRDGAASIPPYSKA